MAVLLPDQLDDFVAATLEEYRRGDWVDISMPHQEYSFAERFMSKKGPKSRGGVQQTWDVQVSNLGNARMTELYATDQVRQKNVLTQGKQQWAKSTANFMYDIDEDAFQTSVEEIINLVLVREHAMWNDWFILMEDQIWGAPTSDTQSPRNISGVPFWIQKNATTGFNGGNPSGFSSGAAGINTTTYAKWKNFTGTYSSVSRTDLVASWIKAVNFCKFKAAHSHKQLDAQEQREFWTTFRLVQPLWEFLDSRNDNLTDVAGMASSDPKFMGIPVRTAWALENAGPAIDTSDPLYGIDWGTMEFFFSKGREMRLGPIERAPASHTVRERHLDSFCNLTCNNRRRNFVLYQA